MFSVNMNVHGDGDSSSDDDDDVTAAQLSLLASTTRNLVDSILENSSNEEISRLADNFRSLRNAVPVAIKRYFINWAVYEPLLIPTLNLLEQWSTEIPENQAIVRRCGLQFLGNLISSYKQVSTLVWNKTAESYFWLKLLATGDSKTSTYASMALYNCFKNDPSKLKNRKGIFERSMHLLASHADNDWHRLNAELILTQTDTLVEWWPLASFDMQDLTAELLVALLEENKSTINGRNLQTVVEAFCEHMKIFDFEDLGTDEFAQKLLQVVAEASASSEYVPFISLVHQLPNTVVHLLTQFRKKHSAQPDVKPSFGVVSHLYDIQRNLLRIIGNLSYQNRSNQLILHHLEAIPLALDCTVPDPNNPFLTQWAILAVRNLCENCPENQSMLFSIISQKPQAVIDREKLLEEMGMKAEIDSVSGLLKLVKIDH